MLYLQQALAAWILLTGAPAIQDDGAPPVIVVPPADATVLPREEAVFSVTVTDADSSFFQWARDGVSIPAATTSAYRTPPVRLEDDGATFTVTVRNRFGTVTSRPAVL